MFSQHILASSIWILATSRDPWDPRVQMMMSAGPAHLRSSQLWSVFGQGLVVMMALTCPGDSLIFTRHCPLKNHFHLRRDRLARSYSSSSCDRLMFEVGLGFFFFFWYSLLGPGVFKPWSGGSVIYGSILTQHLEAGGGERNICKIARQHCKQSVSRFVVASGNNDTSQNSPSLTLKKNL